MSDHQMTGIKSIDLLIVGGSWVGAIMATASLSIIPIIMSSAVSIMAAYKYYLEIKKLKNK